MSYFLSFSFQSAQNSDLKQFPLAIDGHAIFDFYVSRKLHLESRLAEKEPKFQFQPYFSLSDERFALLSD